MHITLLPPLLPAEAVTPVGTSQLTFTPGERLIATVVATGLERIGLSLGGRDVTAQGDLPYPLGTRLQLEVVEGGRQPRLRFVAVEAEPVQPQVGTPNAAPTHPAVSAVGYGLAAAILGARTGPDLASAAASLRAWLPAMVNARLLTPEQAETLRTALAPIEVPASATAISDGARMEAFARALADRVNDGGLLLERRLADVVRDSQRRPGGTPGPTVAPGSGANIRDAAARDLRSRLGVLAHMLEHAPGLQGARDAVGNLHDALLAQQARAAAHLAQEGAVDVRVPLLVDQHETNVRLRIMRDAPGRGRVHDSTPWRQVRLDLDLEALGRVHVRIGLVQSQVQVEFLVEQPGAADCIEAGLGELSSVLEGAGFARVLSRVVVDPVTACAPDQLPELPRGAIVDADA